MVGGPVCVRPPGTAATHGQVLRPSSIAAATWSQHALVESGDRPCERVASGAGVGGRHRPEVASASAANAHSLRSSDRSRPDAATASSIWSMAASSMSPRPTVSAWRSAVITATVRSTRLLASTPSIAARSLEWSFPRPAQRLGFGGDPSDQGAVVAGPGTASRAGTRAVVAAGVDEIIVAGVVVGPGGRIRGVLVGRLEGARVEAGIAGGGQVGLVGCAVGAVLLAHVGEHAPTAGQPGGSASGEADLGPGHIRQVRVVGDALAADPVR